MRQFNYVAAKGWHMLHTAPLEAIEATIMHILSLQESICLLLRRVNVTQLPRAEVHLGMPQPRSACCAHLF